VESRPFDKGDIMKKPFVALAVATALVAGLGPMTVSAVAQGAPSNPSADLQTCTKGASFAACSCWQKVLTPAHFSVLAKYSELKARKDISDDVKQYQTQALLGGGPEMYAMMNGFAVAEKQCPSPTAGAPTGSSATQIPGRRVQQAAPNNRTDCLSMAGVWNAFERRCYLKK
jgi:hypothetical protein